MKYKYLPHKTTSKPLIPKAMLSIGLLLATFFKKAIYPLVRCNTHLPAYQTGPADRQLQHPLRRWQFCWHGRVAPLLAMLFPFLLMVSNHGICAEADDSAGGAYLVNLDQEVSGVFEKNDNTDYYTFTLHTAGNVTVTLKHDNASSKYELVGYIYQVGDLKNDLHELRLQNTSQSTYVQEGLPAGTYYFKINKTGTGADLEQYQLMVNFEASDFYEKSPNDKEENATPMGLNQEYTGNLHNSSDKDFYKITLPSDGNVTVTLNSPGGKMVIHLYLSGNTSTSLHDLQMDQDVHFASIQEGLAAGDYYLKVLSLGGLWDSGQYHLTVAFEASDFYEKSPNNNVETATPIVSLNQPYTGNLSSSDDRDFHKFTLSTMENITLVLAQDNPRTSNVEYWEVTLYQGGDFSNGLLSFSLKGELQSNHSATKELMAGDYYLEVSLPNSSFYNRDQYHITVSTGTVSNVGDESTVGDIPITGDTGNTEGSATPLEEPVVYLLLHGLNSGPETWNDLVGGVFELFGGKCLDINEFSITGGPKSTQKSRSSILTGEKEFFCYRILFVPRIADDGIVYKHGDGSTYRDLAYQVKDVIDLIMKHGNPKPASIVLVGHSRGGLAARAYLQSRDLFKPEEAPVKALLTIGTPHQGSPFGRIKRFLDDNNLKFGVLEDVPDINIDLDWVPSEVDGYISNALTQLFNYADDIKGQARFAWSPSTSYLASSFDATGHPVRDDVSKATWDLNDGAKDLPERNGERKILYGQIVSVGLPLGELNGFNILKMTFLEPLVREFEGIKQSVGDTGSSLFGKLPAEAQNYGQEVVNLTIQLPALITYVKANLPPETVLDQFPTLGWNDELLVWAGGVGDGIVPEISQRLDAVPGLPSSISEGVWSSRVYGVLHTKETGQLYSIRTMLDKLSSGQ